MLVLCVDCCYNFVLIFGYGNWFSVYGLIVCKGVWLDVFVRECYYFIVVGFEKCVMLELWLRLCDVLVVVVSIVWKSCI